MLFRIFFYLLGYALAVSGGVSTVAYLNLLSMGYGMLGYANYIVQRPECYLLPTGIIILTASIYYPKPKKIV
jgi:hypothetical protein